MPRAAKRNLARSLLAAALLAALAGSALAQQNAPQNEQLPTVLYGMGPDPRERVQMDEMPWRAVGRLNMATANYRGSCTGAVIAPAKVLTAAHCLFNERTGGRFPLDGTHFLLGFDRGKYAAAAGVVSAVIGPGYDNAQIDKTRGSDWAVLTLDRPVGQAGSLLALAPESPAVGTLVSAGGYNKDYLEVLIADEHCRILGFFVDANGRRLISNDCSVKQGVSGAPMLIYQVGRWLIAGVEVATGREYTRSVASIPDPAIVGR